MYCSTLNMHPNTVSYCTVFGTPYGILNQSLYLSTTIQSFRTSISAPGIHAGVSVHRKVQSSLRFERRRTFFIRALRNVSKLRFVFRTSRVFVAGVYALPHKPNHIPKRLFGSVLCDKCRVSVAWSHSPQNAKHATFGHGCCMGITLTTHISLRS